MGSLHRLASFNRSPAALTAVQRVFVRTNAHLMIAPNFPTDAPRRNGRKGPLAAVDELAANRLVDNYLMEDRVRRVFPALAPVEQGLEHLGFLLVEKVAAATMVHDDP